MTVTEIVVEEHTPEGIPEQYVGNHRKLNPEVKTAWLEALRSGRYKQGKRSLALVDIPSALAFTHEERMNLPKQAYCCLGVLCEISPFPFDPLDGNPDRFVTEWAAGPVGGVDPWLTHYSPRVIYKGKSTPLTMLNDLYNLSFNEIADLIQEQL